MLVSRGACSLSNWRTLANPQAIMCRKQSKSFGVFICRYLLLLRPKQSRVTYLPFGQRGRGDVLVFLTGREEIDRCLSELADLIPTCVYTLDINLRFKFYRCHRLPKTASRMSLLPLYAGLPTEDQMRVFEAAEPGVRKVVLATNIAEASSLSTFARTFF